MIILLIVLVSKMNYWSIPYTAGWIIGLVLFGKSLYGLLGLVVCIVAGVIYLCIKFKNKFRIYKILGSVENLSLFLESHIVD